MKKVLVMMSTYNGEKFIEEQIKSIINQEFVKTYLIISDDKSSDNTLKILEKFKSSYPENFLEIHTKNKFGSPSKNFFYLINNCPDNFDYYAISDQDDVWGKHKIFKAIKKIDEGFDIYGSRTTIVNKNLEKLDLSPLFNKKPSFANAIVQSIAGGNTMVFNKKLLLKLKFYNFTDAPSYDWFIYIFSTYTGLKFYYDEEPNILYRQHGQNEIGSNLGFINQLKRMQLTFKGKFLKWKKQNLLMIKKFEHEGTFENKHLVNLIYEYQNNYWLILFHLIANRLPFYRQTKAGNLMLKIAFLLRLI